MGNFKLGMCMWGFPLGGPSGVRLAAQMGFAGAEISLGSYENRYPLSNQRIQEEYLKVSEEQGIELTSISVEHLNQYGLTNPLESRKGTIAMEGCRRAVDTAAAMGISVIQFPSFNDGQIRTEEDFKNTCEKLRILCEIAGERDLIIATENALSVENSRRMMEEVGFDNFRIMFDTQNYYLDHQADTANVLKELYAYVIQIHLKDGYNGKISGSLLGSGESGFLKTADVIKETRCSEWLLLENYYNLSPLNLLADDPFEIVERDMKIAKQIFEIGG